MAQMIPITLMRDMLDLKARKIVRPPGRLFVYQWQGVPVFMRISLNGDPTPPCPYLYDEVVEIPVVNAGDPPPVATTRQTPLIADWLADLFDEEEL